jgi:tetratricopeptide (TPR) repeat protein
MKIKSLQSILIVAICLHGLAVTTQANSGANQTDQLGVDEPIVMLRGWGAVHHAAHDRARTAVGINIVTTVARVEGSRLWVTSTGGDNSGWIDSREVLPLTQAIPYFNSLIAHNPLDWDAYLRRAEAEHALNQRDVATADYTRAIELHPGEAFLYLRRGRHYNTLKLCENELRDFETAIRLAPHSSKQDYNLVAELYSLESGVYANCPDVAYRDPRRALATARRAIALDPTRPTLLTILAGAYERSGDLQKAIKAQRQALASPRFPPGYRQDGERQLRHYEQALADEPKDQ